MKVILCLCLVAPLVFGSATPAESENDIQVYDFLDDYLSGPTEEQKKCIKDAVNKIKEANPDLDWWFNDLEKLYGNIKSKYHECKSIDKEPQQKKCLIKLRIFAKMQLLKIFKSLPEDKKEVLTQLKKELKKCSK